MPEKLATRPEARQEAAPSDTDAVFEDIMAQEFGEKESTLHDIHDSFDTALLPENESATIDYMESQFKDDSTEDSDTSPQSLVVTKPDPITPTPTQTPQSPPTPPPTNVQTQTTDTTSPVTPQSPPPPTQERTPVDLQPQTSEFTMVMIDQSKDARDFARDAADARLTSELNEGGKFRRFIKGIWKGNIAREFYRQQYIREAQAQIEAGQDVLLHETGDTGQRTRAQMSTIERFQSEHHEMLNRGAGEGSEKLAKDSELAVGLKGVIRDFVEGKLTNEGLKEERNRVIEAYRAKYGDAQVGEGLVRIDNMLDIAESVKGAIEHGESLDNVMANMKIITGEARTGARSEASHNRADKAIEWLGKRKILSVLPDSFIATATAVATGILKVGSTKTIGAVFQTLLPGVGSAVIAGVREMVHLKKERNQHMREMAMGKEMTPAPEPKGRLGRFLRKILGNRREQLEATRYSTESAVDLTNRLRDHQNNILMDDADRKPGQSRDDALREALAQLSAVEARTLIADTQKKDLISFSDVAKVNDERMQLALARAELKVLLTKELDDATKARLQLDINHTVNDLINNQAGATIDLIKEDISAKDKAFRGLRNRRVAKMATIGLVTGLLMGMGAQEAVAAFDGTRVGVFEQMAGHQVDADGDQHQTLLRGLVHGDGPEHYAASTEMGEPANVGDHGTLQVSKDHNLVRNPDGTFNLVDPNGKASVENLKMNPDGTMPQESEDLLRSHGMNVDKSASYTTQNEVRQQVGLDTFMENRLNSGEAVHVTRDFWYDNNTAPFDKNELGLHRGGVGGTGINADGNYEIVAEMKPGGSYHDDQVANFMELGRQGKLKITLSPTGDTQTTPLIVEMKPGMVPETQLDGSVKMVEKMIGTISPESNPGQFIAVENGRIELDGKYAEVSEMGQIDSQGVQHIRPLATWVGRDIAGPVTDIVKTPEFHPITKITTGGYEGPNTFTEMAPTNFVNSRRAIEVVGRREREDTRSAYYSSYNGYDYRRMSPEDLRRLQDGMSPRLWSNPDVDLNPAEEFRWYRSELLKRRGGDYLNEIDRKIQASPELSNLGAPVKDILIMPVNAAGDKEKRIYDVLAAEAAQDPEKLKESMYLLHVNWFQDLMNDPEKRDSIEQVRADIERAKVDFPQLSIATIETEWDRNEVSDGVIGHVSRRLNDAALLSIDKAMEEGRMPPDHKVIITRRDADPIGLHRGHLKHMHDAADENPETDVFTGTTSFDNAKADRLPGLVFAGNFMQALELLSTRTGRVHTGGANFAIRAEMLAAIGLADDGDNGAGSDDVALGHRISFARSRDRLSYIGGPGPVVTLGASSGSGAQGTPNTHRKVAKRVAGARIDTDSDREEALYIRGVPIIFTWSGGAFDKNGYADRDAAFKGSKRRMRERLMFDGDTIVDRIEKDLRSTIALAGSESLVRTALAFTFAGMKDKPSTEAYELTFSADGGVGFKLTDVGKQEILRHLRRSEGGRRDSYGRRKLRQLYGKGPRQGQLIRV